MAATEEANHTSAGLGSREGQIQRRLVLLLNHSEDAIICLKKGRAGNPRFYYTHLWLAAALGLQNELEEAGAALRQAITLKPELVSQPGMRALLDTLILSSLPSGRRPVMSDSGALACRTRDRTGSWRSIGRSLKLDPNRPDCGQAVLGLTLFETAIHVLTDHGQDDRGLGAEAGAASRPARLVGQWGVNQ